MSELDFGTFNLNLNLNFNQEVNRDKAQKLKFTLNEQYLSIALLTDTTKSHEKNNLL